MASRLLIINCPSEYFVYIPMGTFGLCDYLSRTKLPAKILNLALYEEKKRESVLHKYLEKFHPTHVALILHWQETAEGFLRVGKQVKRFNRDIQIITGGFTAGYFGEDLLNRCRFLDYVIKGDPEEPLRLLLSGTEESAIPNLIYRRGSGIQVNGTTYFSDENTLSNVSFSKLACLYDYTSYLNAINTKLGFPVFIGRGCVHDCDYCGGSCSAFRLHSMRNQPVTRSVAAVIADLKRLKRYTEKIYLCHENDTDYIKNLFRAMKKEESLVKTFHLNYGAWQLPDEELLLLYRDLFISSGNIKPVFELSPEVFADKSRKKIKKGKVYFSIGELKENLNLINSLLGDSVNVSVFFSRYHDTSGTYREMKKEITGIFRLKHDLVRKKTMNTKVLYDHLSTDVASRYWESHVANPRDFNTLISGIRRLKAEGRNIFPVNNLCVYIPDALSARDIMKCELLMFILEKLEKEFREMFHILFACLDEEVIALVEEIIAEAYLDKPDNVFRELDPVELLHHLEKKIRARESWLSGIPFIRDLALLNTRKAKYQAMPDMPQNLLQTHIPVLNDELISVHDHDYLDLTGFLGRLNREGVQGLIPEKTVFIFLTDQILSMTYETYRVTLKEFERGISVDEYHNLMQRKGIFSPSYHKGLIEKLFRSSVLY